MGRAEPGRVLAARYRLRAVIRGDDMGDVWLASDGLLHRDVVLRAIPWAPPAEAGDQESWRARAHREANALAQLDHPNIAGILGIAEDYGEPWMVFEAAPYRFPNRPLGDIVQDDGPLRPEQAAAAGRQVLAAIREAHAVGVLHRDIKPASVLLGAGNRVMLADFGLVTADGSPALTTPAVLTGSPWYMAPERVRGEPATPAADLWSLGAVLYAAVEGRAPFGRESTVAVLTAITTGYPDPPRRAGPLWPVISGLLRKDPMARPDPAGLDWLLWRVAAGRIPVRVAAPGPVREPAGTPEADDAAPEQASADRQQGDAAVEPVAVAQEPVAQEPVAQEPAAQGPGAQEPGAPEPAGAAGEETGAALGEETGAAPTEETGAAPGAETGAAPGEETGATPEPAGAVGEETGGVPEPAGAVGEETGGVPEPAGAVGEETGAAPGEETGGVPEPAGAVGEETGGVPEPAGAAAVPRGDVGTASAALPVPVTVPPRPQMETADQASASGPEDAADQGHAGDGADDEDAGGGDAGDGTDSGAGSPADFVPGFAPRDRDAAAAEQPHGRKRRRHWWITT